MNTITIKKLPVSLILGVGLLLAGRLAAPAADSVALNGITCLFGEKMAFLLLYQPAQTKPLSFTLAEGESQFGFKLLAVDAVGHRVQIEKCGLKSYLRLGNAPDLSAPANTKTPVDTDQPVLIKPIPTDRQAVASYLTSDEMKRIQAGNPSWNATMVGTGYSSGSGQNTSATQNAAAGANDVGQNAGAGTSASNSNHPVTNPVAASAPNNYASELWYQESLSIEQSRAMTVDDVLAGKLTPFPRTPLTPSGTPGQLVSQEVYFANYVPGFHVTGFLNQ